jgi:hypothetical protein
MARLLSVNVGLPRDRYQIGAKNAQLSDAFLGASGWVGFSKASH